jgi:hypothetical protein
VVFQDPKGLVARYKGLGDGKTLVHYHIAEKIQQVGPELGGRKGMGD